VEKLTLTTAEITFILTFAEDPQRARAYPRLRITPEDRADAVARAGLSSLVVRGLVAGNGNEITLSPAVATVLQGLSEPSLWVSISALTSDAADAAHLYAHSSGMFLLSPRAYGCFEVQGVRRGIAPAEIIGSVTRRFVLDRRPAMVSCQVESAAGEKSAALLVDAGGSASVAVGETRTTVPSLDEALRLFSATLAEGSPELTAIVG
jgi:hypothetical protein